MADNPTGKSRALQHNPTKHNARQSGKKPNKKQQQQQQSSNSKAWPKTASQTVSSHFPNSQTYNGNRRIPIRGKQTRDQQQASTDDWPYRPIPQTIQRASDDPRNGTKSTTKLKFVRHRSRRNLSNPTSFLSLPRELRDMVYEECIDLSGIKGIANEVRQGYWEGIAVINTARRPDKVLQLFQRLDMRHGQSNVHTIWLINRQIHAEATSILQKRSLLFTGPPINHPKIFPLQHIIGDAILRNVKHVYFEMPMQAHTDATMLGELEQGSNWFHHHNLNNESLKDAQCWVHFLGDIVLAIRSSGAAALAQTFHFLVTQAKDGRKNYSMPVNDSNLDELRVTVDRCLKTRKLETFLAFLERSKA